MRVVGKEAEGRGESAEDLAGWDSARGRRGGDVTGRCAKLAAEEFGGLKRWRRRRSGERRLSRERRRKKEGAPGERGRQWMGRRHGARRSWRLGTNAQGEELRCNGRGRRRGSGGRAALAQARAREEEGKGRKKGEGKGIGLPCGREKKKMRKIKEKKGKKKEKVIW